MNIHEIIFHTCTMHQPTRLLVHWHMFTNQQKLCTKLIHCHVCKSYRVIKISKNPKRIKKKQLCTFIGDLL